MSALDPDAARADALAASAGVALDHAPVAPFMSARTAHPPGIAPLDEAEWLHSDETFAAQMAARDALIAARRAKTVAHLPEGDAAAAELLELVAAHAVAHHGAAREGGAIRRRDGVRVALDDDQAVAIAGRLAQEDLLLLERPDGAEEHVLVSGVLCFPAYWTLTEKIGRPLVRIHKPVHGYEGELAKRVQRLFDGVRAERPLWRANWNFQAERALWTPMREAEKTGGRSAAGQRWLRVERQTVRRLPRTGAVVFGVRTLLTPLERLSAAQWSGLARALAELPEEERNRKAGAELLAEADRRAERARRPSRQPPLSAR